MYYSYDNEGLRREIEIRLLRETIYKAVDALNTKQSLKADIEKNDDWIRLIGEFMKANGDPWEKYLEDKRPCS